jgi:hypothetical protein
MSDIGGMNEGDMALITNLVARAITAQKAVDSLLLTHYEARALEVAGKTALTAEAGRDNHLVREQEWQDRLRRVLIIAERQIRAAGGQRNARKVDNAIHNLRAEVAEILNEEDSDWMDKEEG